jgi:hypothetical protein
MELILIVAGIALLVYLRNKWLSTPSRVSIPDQTPEQVAKIKAWIHSCAAAGQAQ